MSETTVPDLADFRARAREWIGANLPVEADEAGAGAFDEAVEQRQVARHRALQRLLWDGGYAGLCFPAEYGGRGLAPEFQAAFDVECQGRAMPTILNSPTLVPCGALLLEVGTEAQKLRHLPPLLRGEQLWVQLLSEPIGGSDLAGAITTATPDGDSWVLNGTKVWTSRAAYSDFGLCLARTDWNVPKHQGLSVFVVDLSLPGVEVRRIEMLDGSQEFCEVFLEDVVVSADDVVGEVGAGWSVAQRWLGFEKLVQGGTPLLSGHRTVGAFVVDGAALLSLARSTGCSDDPLVRQAVGEGHALNLVGAALTRRFGEGMRSGAFTAHAGTIPRIFRGGVAVRTATIAMEIAGPVAAAHEEDDRQGRQAGLGYLMRQGACIGGGTVETARNVLSERVLGMPREAAADRGVSYRQVRGSTNPAG